ncbi:hypothetical protein [Mycobacteroides abscessus]|uniref:hypothetical protein n=1 Tax=Mycobacteroides abscessus TaxID=36809 RepID=UPI002105AD1C|nr:hypothetical protein [Mycobacteroides abscessus]
MTKCKRCERATDLFVCKACVAELRKRLADLPWWIDRLTETAVGQANLGDGARKGERRDVLHGDDTLVSHVEPFPRDKDTTPTARDHRDRHQAALWHALALGRVNGRASDELDRIENALSTTIRDMCETRGLEVPRLSSTASLAMWLRNHASVVAHQEDGAHICDEIERMCRNIVRIVNRPPEPMTLGPCITDPAPDEVLAERGRRGDNATRCGYALMAPSHSGSVVCPQCDTAHPVADVLAHNLGELDDRNATVRELVDVILPRLDEHVPQSTIERWIRRGWVPVRGRDAHGHQMVRIGDVRAVRAERPRNAKRSGAKG